MTSKRFLPVGLLAVLSLTAAACGGGDAATTTTSAPTTTEATTTSAPTTTTSTSARRTCAARSRVATWQIVTVGGEIVRSSGAITGGSGLAGFDDVIYIDGIAFTGQILGASLNVTFLDTANTGSNIQHFTAPR